jgi:hypothetical protein
LRNENSALKDQLSELKESLDLIASHHNNENSEDNHEDDEDGEDKENEATKGSGKKRRGDLLALFVTNEKKLKEEISSLHEELNDVKYLLDQTQNLRKIEQDTMQKYKDQLQIHDVSFIQNYNFKHHKKRWFSL